MVFLCKYYKFGLDQINVWAEGDCKAKQELFCRYHVIVDSENNYAIWMNKKLLKARRARFESLIIYIADVYMLKVVHNR